MRKSLATLVGGVFAASVLVASMSPAVALGGCGPNMHRGANGACYWGGQNQSWCLRKTGHPATRMPNGEMVCYR